MESETGIVKHEPKEKIIGFEEFPDDSTSKKGPGEKNKKKGGGFQLMGLSYPVLKGVLKRGYKVPTPIQRKTIPVALEGRDIVAMARTGSGKTACFLIPLFEKLKEHSGNGTRALLLSPTRELALQTLKFVKELGRFTNLRSCVILGGDPMDSQFSSVHSSPDIIIATPGRFLHICVEMNLKLNAIQYVVFDEADRLFEMGLSEQLTEIVQRLPETRQTVLFSATLPKVLVQFAKAGLCDPVLVRLDVESKIPSTLEIGFFHCRPEERDAALLCIIKHVVKDNSMTAIFAATKHHVEYLHLLLDHISISNTFIYSDLDASARKINAAKFQAGKVRVLIVTDVAARGIDIPQLDYVINYNFPAKPKLFVHRVGRCARAGRKGQAFSLVTCSELCYMLDLHLFLGRPVTMVTSDNNNSKDDGLFGKIPQQLIEEELSQLVEWADSSIDVAALKTVMTNGYKNYTRSRPAASKDSVKRAKTLDLLKMRIHPSFLNVHSSESDKLNFINKMKNYKPPITIFELGQSANSISSLSMRVFRKMNKETIANFKKKKEDENKNKVELKSVSLEGSNVDDIEGTFNEVVTSRRKRKKANQSSNENIKKTKSNIDTENFIHYKPSDDQTEQGYAVNDFKNLSTNGTLELTGDSTSMIRTQQKVQRKWDPRKKKYVTDNNKEKMMKSESGQLVPITFKSGRYQKWQEKSKIRMQMEENSDDEANEKLRQKGAIRLDTHWGRHNMKILEKEKYKPLQIDTKHILKQRKIKEKRRKRNGRKPNKKDKVKKKSAKFNKF